MIDTIITTSIGVTAVVILVVAAVWLLERHREALGRMAELGSQIVEGAAETASKAITAVVAICIVIAACTGFYKLGSFIQGLMR